MLTMKRKIVNEIRDSMEKYLHTLSYNFLWKISYFTILIIVFIFLFFFGITRNIFYLFSTLIHLSRVFFNSPFIFIEKSSRKIQKYFQWQKSKSKFKFKFKFVYSYQANKFVPNFFRFLKIYSINAIFDRFPNHLNSSTDRKIDIVFFYNPRSKSIINAIGALLKERERIGTVRFVIKESNSLLISSLIISRCKKLDYQVFRVTDFGSNTLKNLISDFKSSHCLFLNSSYIFYNSFLNQFAQFIDLNESASIIYADEDSNFMGMSYSHYFKPEWSYDFFLSNNYLGDNVAFNTKLLRKITAASPSLKFISIYDLIFRVAESAKFKDIGHISCILFGKVASFSKRKAQSFKDSSAAINEFFKRNHIRAKSHPLSYGHRIKYDLPKKEPLASLIILTKDHYKLISTCISSILDKTTYNNYEIIIVDNGTTKSDALNYLDKLRSNKKIRILRDDSPFNFSYLNNQAVKLAKGKFIGLINNDIEVITPDWLTDLISLANQPGVGVVGPKLLYPNGTIQHAGTVVGIGVGDHVFKGLPRYAKGYHNRVSLISNYASITAACAILRKDLYLLAGGLNEKNLKVAFNDVDLCLKLIDLGYRNLYNPFVELYHHESASRGYDEFGEKRKRLIKESNYIHKRWKKYIKNDPFYNPNLTREKTNFSIR